MLQFHGPTSNSVLEGFAFQILHGNEAPSILLANFVDGADVRMVQRRCCASLTAKAFESLCVPRQIIRQEFQRDEAAQFAVFRLIHHAHPAASEFLKDAVVGNGLADERVALRHGAAILGFDLGQVNERSSRRGHGLDARSQMGPFYR